MQQANHEKQATVKSVDGAILGYRLVSNHELKPLLVLIHGLASNCTRFSEFVEHTHLTNNWDILRVDLRGHGESMYRGDYTRDNWLDDLNTVLTKENYQQSVLLGHSLGAQIAIDYASRFPDKCRGLILIDPVFPDNLQGRLARAKQHQLLLFSLRKVLRFLNRIGLKRWRLPKRDLRQLDEQTRLTLDENPELKIADLYTNPFADFKYIPLANYLQDISEVIKPLPPLESITQPVLVLLSGGATVSSFDKTRQMINRFPNAHIEIIDADHWLLTEKPQQTREIIENWCSNTFSD